MQLKETKLVTQQLFLLATRSQHLKQDDHIMENDTYLFNGLPYSRQSAVRGTVGVAGNPKLAAGLLLGYFAIGFASYFWAFWSQYSRLTAFKDAIKVSCLVKPGVLRGVQKIYTVITTMIIMDTLDAITAIIFAFELLGYCQSPLTCVYVTIAWLLRRWFGLILHLLNALICLLYLSRSQWGAKMIRFYRLVILIMIVSVPFYIYLNQITVIVLGAITIGLALAIVAKCTKSTTSPAAATPKKLIVLLATLTFGIVFAPAFILECLIMNAVGDMETAQKYSIIYTNVMFFTSVQLLLNGFQCYAILKLPSEEEEQEQQLQQQQQQQQQQSGLENINYDVNVIAP